MDSNVQQLAEQVAAALLRTRKKVCTAESCTGGLIAKTFTDLTGSSDWFDRGFVAYCNDAKSEMLDVPPELIEEYGAVSEAVASAMASGALHYSDADYTIAVTGIAGPGGGSAEKPVGTVWIALASSDEARAHCHHFEGDRNAVREATLRQALKDILQLIAD